VVAGLCLYALGQSIDCCEIQISDRATLQTDEMRMRLGAPTVIVVRAVREGQWQGFAQLFEEGHGVINRAQTGRRQLLLDAVMYLLNGRVVSAAGQHPEHSQPLGCQAPPLSSETLNQFVLP
jgi:hypothetical protein